MPHQSTQVRDKWSRAPSLSLYPHAGLQFCAVGHRRIIWSFRKIISCSAKMKMTAVAAQTSAKAGSRWLLGKAASAAEGDRRASARPAPERRIPAARLLPIVVGALLCQPATANDTAAELATGGIVLTKNAEIEMLSEHLHISSRQIRVRYRFYNTSPEDVTILVAFPMPDITVDNSVTNISIPTHNPQNLLGFTTFVNRKPVTAQVEQKVFARGVDRTADLRRLNIPLAPHLHATAEALKRLPRSAWDELTNLGLAEVGKYDIGKRITSLAFVLKERERSARRSLRCTKPILCQIPIYTS